MINGTYSTKNSPWTKLNTSKVQIAKACKAIDEILDRLGEENYCPYEDLEAIQEKLVILTD
jgi:hypothetical protein